MKQQINPENIQTVYYDLFAGAGGTSTGVVKTRINDMQCSLVAACINHDINAIKSHRSNHKQTLHFTEDITELYNTSRWNKLIAHVYVQFSTHISTLNCTYRLLSAGFSSFNLQTI